LWVQPPRRRATRGPHGKYPSGFARFDYVNPDAPKLGVVRVTTLGTFDNFNEVVGGVKGSLATGARVICDTLLAPALDEVSAGYGLLAEAVRHPDDGKSEPDGITRSFRCKISLANECVEHGARPAGFIATDPAGAWAPWQTLPSFLPLYLPSNI
jgi:hypothetical protein